MKKHIIIFTIFILLFSSLAVAQERNNAPRYQVTLLNQEPDPVEPGEIVEIRLQVENVGDVADGDTIVEVIPEFPLLSYGPTSKNIGTLLGQQTNDEINTVDFEFRIDPAAVDGDADFDVVVRSAGIGYSFDFDIDIASRDAVLELEEVFTEPTVVAPGQDAELLIKLTNRDDTVLKNIRLELDFADEDLPIIPFSSSAEKRVDRIAPGESEFVRFGLKVQPEAAAQGYKIPLELVYFDDRGEQFTKDTIVGVTVGDEPELIIQPSRTDIYTAGSSGSLTVEIANPGLVDIKLLTMKVLEGEDFVLLSSQDHFSIGDVDSDDRETEELRIYVDKSVDDQLAIPLELTYRDANNKLFTVNQDLTLPLYSSGDAKRFGLVETSNLGGIIFVLIILIAGGIWWWRRRKKK